MPKHTLAFPYDKFRGAVRDIVQATGMVLFDTPKAGNVSRRYVVPDNPQSTSQSLWRNYLAQAAQGYQALTKTQADAWNAAAALIVQSDVLGVDYELSGISLYVRVNAYRLANGQALTSTPPASAAPSGTVTPGATPLDFNDGTATLDVAVTTSGFPDGTLALLRIARSLGSQARNARTNEYRVQTVSPANSFLTVSSNSIAASIPSAQLNSPPSAAERVGLELAFLNADYVPGTVYRLSNLAMTFTL
jgi:hypothetical protein